MAYYGYVNPRKETERYFENNDYENYKGNTEDKITTLQYRIILQNGETLDIYAAYNLEDLDDKTVKFYNKYKELVSSFMLKNIAGWQCINCSSRRPL